MAAPEGKLEGEVVEFPSPEEQGEPLEGKVKEFKPEAGLSEKKMQDMERVKEENAQAGFDKFAEDSRKDRREEIKKEESSMMGKLRKFLRG